MPDQIQSTDMAPPPGARVVLRDIPNVDFTHYETGVSLLRIGYNDYARAVHAACLRKTVANLDISFDPELRLVCKTCVYHTGMPGIYLHADGRCNMCHTFEDNLARAKATGSLDRELTAALSPSRTETAACDVIVALSGGKDSAAALQFVAGERKLRTIAMLVDNGFIPETVKQNCQAMCDRVGAEFVILGFDFRDEVKAAMRAQGDPAAYPCISCSKRFQSLITDYAEAHGCPRVIMGRNFWTRIEPELSGLKTLRTRNGSEVEWYCLPFLLRWKYGDLRSRLEAVGWNERNRDIPGLSTNCLVPGLVEKHFHRRSGIHPETPLIAHEVIAGFLSREEGLEELAEAGH